MVNIATNINRSRAFWLLQVSGWIFVLYLIYAQAIPAFDYDLGVAMGTQDPASAVTEVGVAYWRGFALADLIFYIPIFVVGLIGHYRAKNWGRIALAAAFGITIYWPITCVTAIFIAQDAPGWNLPFLPEFWVVLIGLTFWGLWGMWRILKELN